MVKLGSPVTRYEASNEGRGNEGSSDSYKSPSPAEPPCTKRQRSSGQQDPNYVPEQVVYDH
jgi:hypothetical protein